MAKFLRYEPCDKCRDRGNDRRGDNRAVYSDGGWHCFSCGDHRGSSTPWKEPIDEPKNSAVLPADFTREVPTDAWKWLLQYGLGWKYWQPFVGWSEETSRLVFTVGPEFSIGRLIGKEPDKRNRKWYVWGNAHENAHVLGWDHTDGKVVLVEDIVSAHKVGQVATCIPLMGTRVFPNVIPVLRHLNQPVLMWLDQDQQNAAQKRAAWLSLMTNLSVQYVFTDKDPKELSTEKIKEIVSE